MIHPKLRNLTKSQEAMILCAASIVRTFGYTYEGCPQSIIEDVVLNIERFARIREHLVQCPGCTECDSLPSPTFLMGE